MHKYEILLTDEQEKRLTEIAVKGGKTKEKVIEELADLLLSSPHNMVGEDSAKAYAECSEIYLAWSEEGKE